MTKKKEVLPFEKAMQKLEDLVGKLESGELNLEKSLDAFEEGMGLAKICEEKLAQATTRVEKIMKDFSGKITSVTATEFEQEESDNES